MGGAHHTGIPGRSRTERQSHSTFTVRGRRRGWATQRYWCWWQKPLALGALGRRLRRCRRCGGSTRWWRLDGRNRIVRPDDAVVQPTDEPKKLGVANQYQRVKRPIPDLQVAPCRAVSTPTAISSSLSLSLSLS